ncbi:MAG: hypothetical protein JXB14_06555 [Candidatus Altiarchaeota archaeon]|nr:hypothetical protein [Candidatus Altiarchaeota archaeon]
MKCRICKEDIRESPDLINLCRYKGGPTHLGCCTNSCSWDQAPCRHSSGVFQKV